VLVCVERRNTNTNKEKRTPWSYSVVTSKHDNSKEPAFLMKRSRDRIHRKTHAVPELRFEERSQLTSYAGLVLFQKLFALLDLKRRLRRCFAHLQAYTIFGHASIFLTLVVHLLLGHRQLRDLDYYRDDPMVLRVLGLSRLPDVSTVSRALAQTDLVAVGKLRGLLRRLVLDRLSVRVPARLTVDFDGSVTPTSRRAEGTAVGYNRKKKGQRSYYPLFCTLAQTGQVFDVLHRSGNVHDSNGSVEFVRDCVEALRAQLPSTQLEVRMDAAFYSDAMVTLLDELGVEFTISVPFERLAALKSIIEQRQRWRPIDEDTSYFEPSWKPKVWRKRYRLVVVRQRAKVQDKEPLQLDLFIPHSYGYGHKAIVTNKQIGASRILQYHNGRGAQEGVFAELKSQAAMSYIPTRTLAGNQTYLLSAVLAHNLGRELQMVVEEPVRGTTAKRAACWTFAKLGTLRQRLLNRGGRLIRPGGRLTLAMGANQRVESELQRYLDALDQAA